MAIRLGFIRKRRVLAQIEQNLVGLQRDMRRNAETHKAMALAQSPDVATLRTFLVDCAAQYLKRLQWVIDLRNDPAKKQALLDVLVTQGVEDKDIVDGVTDLRQAAVALRDAPKGSYVAITAACDAVLATVDEADSLWPE